MERPLYKYMKSKYARRFLKHGELRIGTLYSFRDVERLGPEIGDAEEGTKHLYKSGLTVMDTAFPSSIPKFLSHSINVAENSRLQVIAKAGVGRTFEDPDCYVFCVTDAVDEAAMRQMGYDACVEIQEPTKFFHAIAYKLKHVADFWGAAYVKYTGRRIEHLVDEGIPPAFLKDQRYAHQKEVRAVWTIKSLMTIEPFQLNVKKAARLCRRVG